MNRYALEMNAREKYQNSALSQNLWMLASPRRFGLLSRNASRLSEFPSEMPTNDSMTFLYELRCEFADVNRDRESDLDDVLPMIK